jgi:hypothetical protein
VCSKYRDHRIAEHKAQNYNDLKRLNSSMQFLGKTNKFYSQSMPDFFLSSKAAAAAIAAETAKTAQNSSTDTLLPKLPASAKTVRTALSDPSGGGGGPRLLKSKSTVDFATLPPL